jgi:hypothetical protein
MLRVRCVPARVRRDLTGPLRNRRARLEDAVAGSELVFPVRRLAPDGLKAWKQVVERGRIRSSSNGWWPSTPGGRRLRAALAAVLVRDQAPELRLVRDWRANFFPVGIAHSIVGGSGWEPTPWRAVQRAAWEALR